MPRKPLDLTGKKFGLISVISRAGSDSRGNATWNCLCECGNEKVLKGTNLTRGVTTSCGCKTTLMDLTGQIFGRWTVVKRDESIKGKGNQAKWICRCECGNERPVKSQSLRSGESTSCGCYHREVSSKKNRYELIDDSYYKVYTEDDEFFLIDKDDIGKIEGVYVSIQVTKDTYKEKRYAYGYFNEGKRESLHRHLMGVTQLDDVDVDHINGNETLDNRRNNLRVVERKINTWNRSADSNSKLGVLGISMKGSKYRAYIMTNGKNTDLGLFKTLEDAINARKMAELEQRGELSYFWKENEL